MKVNILEAHDRLKHLFKVMSEVISKGAEDCLKIHPDSLFYQERSPYVYLFAHPRTHDNGVDKRLLWQPRLGKPDAQSNSYLFRAISNTDIVELMWFIPDKLLWDQFKKGNLVESENVIKSIHLFNTNRRLLEQPHPNDLPEAIQCKLLHELIEFKRMNRKMREMYNFDKEYELFMPKSSEESSISSEINPQNQFPASSDQS